MCRLKEGDHGRLARMMQTAESHLVIWRTCARLVRDYPRAPLLTLHDCLVTTAEHAAEFGETLRGEFEAAYGVRPGLKTKAFAD